MSSINTRFGQRTFNPTISTREPGLAFGSGDDFLSPRTINNIGSGFTGSISPVTSNGRYITSLDPYSHNATPIEILLNTNDFSRMISPTTTNHPQDIYQLPVFSSYYQPVPDFGTNPDAITLLSGSTQFQMGLVTEGAPAIPGYPQIGFSTNASALDFMGQTDSFISAILPTGTGQGAFYPNAAGQGMYYPVPQIQPPYYGGFSGGNYPHFAPYYGWGVTPAQIPYPGMGYMPYCPPVYGYPTPSAPSVDTATLVNRIQSNAYELPNYIPADVEGGVSAFISRYNRLSESERVELRQQYANPTTVNETILNSTGITGTGGKYNQGKVTNPFIKAGFLTDTNPFETTDSGMVVTNGNGNRKIKGTQERDILIGSVDRNNIIDGRGGEDDVIGSTKKDLVNVYQGDRVQTGADDDLMFFSFQEASGADRLSVVDGGSGSDIMVLTVNGNPSTDAGSPTFTKLAGGLLSVTFNGIQLLTRNIEKFYVADAQGNIGGAYQVTTADGSN